MLSATDIVLSNPKRNGNRAELTDRKMLPRVASVVVVMAIQSVATDFMRTAEERYGKSDIAGSMEALQRAMAVQPSSHEPHAAIGR